MSKAREDFIARFVEETAGLGPLGQRVYDARLLMRAARTLQRISESECNDNLDDIGTAQREKKEERTVSAVYLILRRYNQGKAPVFVPKFSSDPRGAVLKIKVPSGYTDDWGQEGVCVP